MTPCSICTTPTPDLELKQVCVSGERTLLVCECCICDAVSLYLDAIERHREKLCAHCSKNMGDGCLVGATPDTCF